MGRARLAMLCDSFNSLSTPKGHRGWSLAPYHLKHYIVPSRGLIFQIQSKQIFTLGFLLFPRDHPSDPFFHYLQTSLDGVNDSPVSSDFLHIVFFQLLYSSYSLLYSLVL